MYPQLASIPSTTLWTEEFRGLDRRPRASDGACEAMGNMTGEEWPLLCSRKKRGLVAELENPQGLKAMGKLAWIDGTTLYYGGEATGISDLSLSPHMLPKQLVSMGAYLVILPDKKYFNTADPDDYGNINRLWSGGRVEYSLCDMDGIDYPSGAFTTGPTAPGSPAVGDYWLSTADVPHTLYRYYDDWVSVSSTYVRISSPGIGKGLNAQDSVRLSGIRCDDAGDEVQGQLALLNSTHIVQAVDENFIVVAGVLDAVCEQSRGVVHADRTMPDLDFVIEWNNRLWGCRYGEMDGQTVNGIYASALGDFRNWQKYAGTAEDSYYVNVGTDGPFTGAVLHRGVPYFFKERCVHKIYGEKPANYQAQTVVCDGVKEGSGDTLVSYNGLLYYLSVNGPVRFENIPEVIGEALGSGKLSGGCAGQAGGRYFLSCEGEDGQADLYVLDTARGLWHREDESRAIAFAELGGEMYMLEHNGLLWALGGTAGEPEEDFTWYAESAAQGYEYPKHQYLSRFVFRVKLGAKAQCDFYIMYDSDGYWRPKGSIQGTGRVKLYTLPVIPRRCEHCRLRIEGHGEMQLLGLAREMSLGG